MEAHGEFLRAELGDRELAEAVKKDYRQASLDDPTRALLDFANKLNLEGHTCRSDDLDSLRGQGFSDEDIVDATAIVGIMNYLNRLADALGIELNEEYRHIGQDQ
ncbi:MAG: alkylhydroperoxidase, partial [Acidobacteriota bacterium]